MGLDYLGTVLDRDIKENDIVLMVSLDGAQLYEKKQLDCWMYIWIIINLSLDKHYCKIHVQPGGFIPGPNKPKNIDSFLFIGMHHLAAIQNEGLTVWDVSHDATFISNLHLLFTTADGPGLIYWDGMVGHSGKNGSLLKPLIQCIHGSDHPSIDITQIPLGGSDDYAQNLYRLMTAPNQEQLDIWKTETVLFCMTTDIMHLASNLSDLLLALWHGTIDCGTSDDEGTWEWAVF
ncbi:hypothetical protein BDR05DRAFT_972776 [Suillus weaverae]|nr:hypothetical protein BDR05DRAFT_972776 [Suillus weaverae]